MRHRLGYFYNIMSLAGIVLAAVGAGLMIIFFAMEMLVGFGSQYTGLLVYFIFPLMLVIGLILIPVGMIRERKRRMIMAEDVSAYPILDFNQPGQRRKLIFFIISTLLFLLIISIAVIKGYVYTESASFCGTVCHTVMEPEYVTWSNSPHARVKCAECHVGSGAEYFVRTKLSGTRQLFKVVTGTYATPIETPVTNLRPARDTCEHCHWPEKFYSGRQKTFYHYAQDEKNTPREIRMLLNIGGTPVSPNIRGIHWHIASKVYYQPRDAKRQDIPYIRVQGRDGKITDFYDTEKPLAQTEISPAKQRVMDCIDCHNRPTHIYRSPALEVDNNLVSGAIDPSLPFIKKVSVELLMKPYRNRDEAYKAIASGITSYYRTSYPQISGSKDAAIQNAVKAVQGIYGRNIFPVMKTAWNTHNDNIGHLIFPGCFRCHDGKHKSKDGQVISKDCNLCHLLLGQKQENIPPGAQIGNFVHPVDIGDELVKTNCSDCHKPEAM